jgi:hypothetical protein
LCRAVFKEICQYSGDLFLVGAIMIVKEDGPFVGLRARAVGNSLPSLPEEQGRI